MTVHGRCRKAKFSMARRHTTLRSANLLRRQGSGRTGSSFRSAPSVKRAANTFMYGRSKMIGILRTLVSNSFTIEWPPRSGQTLHFPEVDRAQWFDLKIAHTKILKSQSEFLNRLELQRRAK